MKNRELYLSQLFQFKDKPLIKRILLFPCTRYRVSSTAV